MTLLKGNVISHMSRMFGDNLMQLTVSSLNKPIRGFFLYIMTLNKGQIYIYSSIPFLGCGVVSLIQFLTCEEEKKIKNPEKFTSVVAQKHFDKLQHIII